MVMEVDACSAGRESKEGPGGGESKEGSPIKEKNAKECGRRAGSGARKWA